MSLIYCIHIYKIMLAFYKLNYIIYIVYKIHRTEFGLNRRRILLIYEGCTVYAYKNYEMSYRGIGGSTCLTCSITRI